MKRKLHLQTGIFWEDSVQDSREIIGRHFEVIPVSPDYIFERNLDFALMRGSLDLARRAKRDFKFAETTSWLPPLREHCINSDAIWTDFAHAGEAILRNGSAFIRSNSGFKEIAGEVFDHSRWKTEYQYLKQKNIASESLIVCVAEPIHIRDEYRAIFVNGEIAGFSQYMKDGEPYVKQETPKEALQFAREVAANPFWSNKFDFVIDVGRVGEDWGVVEANAFETSSFYAADLDQIYAAWAESLEDSHDY